MARDLFHENVKKALQEEGWYITDDPLTFKTGKVQVQSRKSNSNLQIKKTTAIRWSRSVGKEIALYTTALCTSTLSTAKSGCNKT